MKICQLQTETVAIMFASQQTVFESEIFFKENRNIESLYGGKPKNHRKNNREQRKRRTPKNRKSDPDLSGLGKQATYEEETTT